MAKLFMKVFAGAAVLAGYCFASEDGACPSSSIGAKGESMLQAQWKMSGQSRSQSHKQRSLHRNQAVGLQGQTPIFLGSLVSLDAAGYKTVTGTCCPFQMELFLRRLITGMGFQLCDEGSLLRIMVPLYATCETGLRPFATLSEHIKASTADPKCKMVAPPGLCPAQQLECLPAPPPQQRQTSCNYNIQKQGAGYTGSCELPANAAWCQVRLKGSEPYFMAVYDPSFKDDWVSLNVCQSGFWEEDDMTEFGAPGNMLDIGGNVGYHTFAFASAGWSVNTFEPMAPNLALINATMCRNPALASKINLNRHGLGTKSEMCKMMSPIHNVGDGHVKCGVDQPPENFQVVGDFTIRRLDEVLKEQNIAKVDLVKIDVEGYEKQVFDGAPTFLSQYQPRIIKSEVWAGMVNATGAEYLNIFQAAGYKFFSDSRCQVPLDAAATVAKGGGDFIICK